MARLTEAQHAERRGRITASLAPAILGHDPFCGPLGAYQRIVGETPAAASNPAAAELGHLLEPVVAEMWRIDQSLGIPWELLAVEDTLWHPTLPWLGATIDYEASDPVTGERAVLEIKTTGNRRDWGDDGDAIPDRVRLQVAVQQAVTNSQHPARVAVLFTDEFGELLRYFATDGHLASTVVAELLLKSIPGRFRTFTIARDLELERAVLERLTYFYRDHVKPRVPPTPETEADFKVWLPKIGPTFLEPDDEQAIAIARIAELTRLAKETETELRQLKNSLAVAANGFAGFQLAEGAIKWTTTPAGEVHYMRDESRYLDFRAVAKQRFAGGAKLTR
jgi:predicted phage-related endonuclease